MAVATRTILAGARRPVKGPTYLLGDNSAMMDIIKKDGTTARTRYFEKTTMLVKYAVMRMLVACRLVPTAEMVADIFTKAVDKDTFLLMTKWLLNLNGDDGHRASYARASRLVRMLGDLVDRF